MFKKPTRLIKAHDLRPAPWKDGGGITFEVAISPEGAELAKLDFDWRLSIAQVESSGPFSQFPGYDRKLVVWKGEGLKINGTPHSRLEPFDFKGETPITADLISGSVKDIGIISRRGQLQTEMTVKRLALDESLLFDHKEGSLFVLCATGEVRIDEFYLNPGDFYQRTEPGRAQIKALERSEIVVVRVG